MTPTERRTWRAGVELAFHEWPGAAPPALLLHGIGNYGRYWDLVARAVDGAVRLVAPDARGHGASGRPDDGYAPAEFVADALAILGALGIERALVVGHSMGGSHALRLAAEHPERVLALVLVDVGVEPLREGSDRARRLSLGRPESFADRAAAEEYLRRTSPGYSDEVYADRLAHLFRLEEGRLVWRSSSPALARILAQRAETEERWDLLRRVAAPVTIVRGTRSNVLPASQAERMARELALARRGVRADLVELDSGHNVALERPHELAEIVTSLARSLSTTPGSMRRWIP
ncbi:MAG: alpha/beta hydrolase [Chloroflexota bacterium]|nr:alpha/beta hydrolase [Chloroflexota bacterium]